MMRLSTSRPSWSVPSGFVHVPPPSQAGGCWLLARSWRFGGYGATTGANTASTTSPATSTVPATSPAASWRCMLSPDPDLRVHEAVHEVGDQIHADHDQ